MEMSNVFIGFLGFIKYFKFDLKGVDLFGVKIGNGFKGMGEIFWME